MGNAPSQANSRTYFPKQDPERGGGHMISTDDLEYPREYRSLGNGARRFSNVGLVHTSEHRHTVMAAQSLEALSNLHKAELERKRDAFMDHLKNKYPPQHSLPPSPSPSHGSMRGSSERSAREQQQPNYWSFKSRSPRHSQSTQSGLADQASKLSYASAESLETMSEADMPLGFNRMNRFRQSLPLSRSASQNKLRSPGVLFLQFGDETRRVHITHELSSMETLHALIVHMFPQKLTASMLKSPNTAILIKDEARNVFYELEDVRDIQDRSIIKIYRKEPVYGSYPAAAHLANGDLRREMVYASRESSPTRRLNTLPSSGSSPSSASPARSRLSYSGGRPPSFSGSQHGHHGHHGSPAHGPAGGMTASPSAILERRDVKPDEEVATKNALLKNESLYADPYSLVPDGHRLSIASMGEPLGMPGPGGLYRRGSVRSLSTYSAVALQGDLDDPLYKPGAPLYPDTYSLGTGFRLSSSSSPQKMSDSYSGTLSRGSPVRQSFRKDSSSSVFVDSPKSRPSSSSEPLGVESGRGISGFGNETDTRDRMEAMEKQIASLTGLVQSVLTRAPDSDSTEKTESTSDGSATGTGRLKRKGSAVSALPSLTPSAPLALMPPPAMSPHTSTVSKLQMQLHLHELKQNATDLRKQLAQLRKMQLQNQESVRSLVKRTEAELSVRVCDALRKQEDPLQRQRLLVEEERLKYLNEEELIIQQLHDLEKSVEEIQKESSVNHRHITVQELEEKSTVLRRLGETLTELKNQFPGLQSKMRVVLRVEVEAVKFLKEEPHRLDALLKRCKTITDTLTMLKRQVNEGVRKNMEEFSNPSPKHTSGDDYRKNADFDIPTSPPLNLNETSLANWSPHGHAHPHVNSSPGQLKGRGLDELGGRGGADKASSVEVRLAAERDWEEKRASLTQYSAQDINRLLEETQAELMKAIPDLDFAAKQIKPIQNQHQNQTQNQIQNQNQCESLSSTNATPEHKPNKPQHPSHKVSNKEGGSRRGSDELTVARYRTEKPSKSPPPPPPRRSFPTSPGLTTRSGEIITSTKSIKKSESEETEIQKPHVKLRRSVSEAPRPASTPPNVAGGEREDGEIENTSAELEQFTLLTENLHHPNPDTQPSPVPQIVLTECPTSSSAISTTQVSSSTTQQNKSTGRLSYSSYIVKTPRLSLWKLEPSTNQTRSQIPTLSRTPKELQTDMFTESPSPSPLASKKLERSVNTELMIQESFEIDEENATHKGEDDQSRIQDRKEDIRHSTYQRLDNLEETIRELELSLLDFGTQTIPNWPQSIPDMNSQTSSSTKEAPSTSTMKSSGRGEIQRPPVPPKPFINTEAFKSGGGKAISRLKHLQQSGLDKSKVGKQREDFLKSQGQQQ
ncbi:SRC kinase signaling inhibitor 1 isoform X7 [Hemibagrus wyckioides]|uniref:SRC kinase signaling inhibitor 1 isoform X7 n=1 Tax=Hemibagrus wyckioides TaxID=337641 RepID=UPI00266C04E8|nr:SRC kinase signaling inhibitor 1 isoform X7 [Hemibagrus wyckioides]